MMLVFVLSILYKMALYMIYANFVIHVLSINFYERIYLGHFAGHFQALDPVYALLDGGHPLLASALNNFIPLLVIVVVAVLAYLLNNVRPPLRFAPLILLSVSFYRLFLLPLRLYPAHNIATAIVLFIPLIYLSVKIAKRDFSAPAEGLRRRMKSLVILAIAPLIIFVFGGFAMLSSSFYFHYVIIFIGSAMGVLRIARASENMRSDPKFLLISLVPVVVTTLLILASQQIAGLIWRVIQFIGTQIIMPVVNFLARGIEWFFALFYTHDPSATPPIDFIYDPGSEITFTPPPLTGTPVHSYILAAILTILLAIVVYRVCSRRKKQAKTKKGFSEVRSTVTSLQEKQSKKHAKHMHRLLTPRDPRMAVRYHYRQFLRLCAQRGCPPEQGDTSEEINAKNKTSFPVESMSRLRELYIKARYSEHDIEKSESKEASNLLKEGFEL